MTDQNPKPATTAYIKPVSIAAIGLMLGFIAVIAVFFLQSPSSTPPRSTGLAAEKAEAKKDGLVANEMFRREPGLWEFQVQIRVKLSFGPGDKFWQGDRVDNQPVVQSRPGTMQMCADEKLDEVLQQEELAQKQRLKRSCEPTNWKKDGDKISSKTVCKESDATYTGSITYEQTYTGSKSNYRGASRTTFNPPQSDGAVEYTTTVLSAQRLGPCKPGQKPGDVVSTGPTPGDSKPSDMESGRSRGQIRNLPTVDGPEAADLNKKTAGCVVMDRPVGGIVALEISTKDEIVVRPCC